MVSKLQGALTLENEFLVIAPNYKLNFLKTKIMIVVKANKKKRSVS